MVVIFTTKGQSFIIISSLLLCESPDYQPSFASFKAPISPAFNFVNPFTAYGYLATWQSNYIPGMICLQGVKILLHGLLQFKLFVTASS